MPQGWCICKVNDIAEILSGVSYNKGDIQENGLKIIRGGNIQEGKIIEQHDDVYITESYINNATTIKRGDIVMVASTGSQALIGKTGYAEKDYTKTQIGAFLRIIRTKNLQMSAFLNFLLLCEDFRKHIKSLASGTNINNIKNRYITDYVFRLPPQKEIDRIVIKVKNLFNTLDSISAEL